MEIIDLLGKEASLAAWKAGLGVIAGLVTIIAGLGTIIKGPLGPWLQHNIKKLRDRAEAKRKKQLRDRAEEVLPYIISRLEQSVQVTIEEVEQHMLDQSVTLEHSIRESNSFQDFAKKAIQQSQARLEKMIFMVQQNTAEQNVLSIRLKELEDTQNRLLKSIKTPVRKHSE